MDGSWGVRNRFGFNMGLGLFVFSRNLFDIFQIFYYSHTIPLFDILDFFLIFKFIVFPVLLVVIIPEVVIEFWAVYLLSESGLALMTFSIG